MALGDFAQTHTALAIGPFCHKAPTLVLACKALSFSLKLCIKFGQMRPEVVKRAIKECLRNEQVALNVLHIDTVAALACQDNEFAYHVLARKVDAGVGLAVTVLLCQMHGTAERNIGRQGVEHIIERATQHSLNFKHTVARATQVADGADDGQAGTHIGLEQEFYATLTGCLFKHLIVVVIRRCGNFVGSHNIYVVT